MLDFEEKKRTLDRSEVLSFFWEVIKIIVVALVIIIPVRYYLFQPFFVKGASMEPTFNDGDYVLIDELSYNFRDLKRGEVIIFRAPPDHSQFYIKRVIGLPSEQIEVKDNKILIFNKQNPQGFILDESGYLDSSVLTLGDLKEKLGEHEYFVLGDNRLHSSDSRSWGIVDKNLVTGRVLLRAWPLDQITKFKPTVYPVN